MTEDILRIAHETELIRPVPELSDTNEIPPNKLEEKVLYQIRQRRKIINGLKMGIEELQALLKN